MPVVTFACPKCGKVLKSPTPIPAGKKIKCPTCAAVFLMPEQDEDEMAAAVSDKPRRPSSAAPVRKDEDDDDDLPPRRARQAADDDDEDEPRPRRRSRAEEEDDDDDRPRRKKAKTKSRRRAGGMGLLIGVAAVVLLLVLGGGGTTVYFVWFHGVNRGSGNEDPLAFVPPGSEILVGTDYATLLSDPALGPQLEKSLREQGKSGDLFDNVKKETGLEFKDLFAQTVVASDLDSLNTAGMMAGGMRGGPVAPPPPGAGAGRNAITMIVRSSRPFDQKKVVGSCKDPHHRTAHGKSYYEVNEGEFRTLFMPSNRTLIMSTLSAAELDALFASNGTTPSVSADAAALVREVDKTTFWVALPFEGKTRTRLDDLLRNAPLPGDMQSLGEQIGRGKGAAIWGSLEGDSVKLGVNLACADAGGAAQLAQAAEKSWNGNKLQLMMAPAGLTMAGMPKTGKVLGELIGSVKFTSDGTMAKVSASTSRASLTAAVSEAQARQNMQNPGGGFGRGGLPPNPGPGGGRPGRGPGKR
jgi:hypothetical protein